MNTLLTDNGAKDRLVQFAAVASVTTAVALLLVKTYAWWVSGSVSLLASLVDSLIDAAASVVNYIAVRYAMQPADKDHRFGHGKAEALAGLGQSVLIMVSAGFVLIQGIERFITPQPLKALGMAMAIMLGSIMATSMLVLFQRYVVRQTGSLAIKADSLHYFSDLLTNLGIVAGLLLVSLGWLKADGLLAIAIALYIFFSAISIWNESVQHLLDREMPDSERRIILDLAHAHPEVLGVHELRTRQSGRKKIIQMHLELNPSLPLVQAHAIGDQVEARIRREFPDSDILLHQDPYISDDSLDSETSLAGKKSSALK